MVLILFYPIVIGINTDMLTIHPYFHTYVLPYIRTSVHLYIHTFIHVSLALSVLHIRHQNTHSLFFSIKYLVCERVLSLRSEVRGILWMCARALVGACVTWLPYQ